MNIRPKIVAAAVATLALSGAGIGAAVAASASSASTTHTVVNREAPAPDPDNIQQGDQTSPDTSSGGSAMTASVHKAASGEENGSESEQPSDGPGGHADPSGDVQHEFDGVE